MRSQTVSRSRWIPWLLAICGFWLSSDLVVDLLVMPVMQVSGMTQQADFAPMGYTLFWSLNRLELLCAAVLVAGVLALRRRPQEFDIANSGSGCRWALVLGLGLLGLTLVDTYVLTPEMSALAASLDPFGSGTAMAPEMTWLHGAYWFAEIVKFMSLGLMARLCYGDLRNTPVQETSSQGWV